MGAAFGWGTLAGSSLVIGALVALRFHVGLRWIGLIMGFGAGVLISALAFDLVDEAAATSLGTGYVAVGVLAGCAVFFGGASLIDRLQHSRARMSGQAVPAQSATCGHAARGRQEASHDQ